MSKVWYRRLWFDIDVYGLIWMSMVWYGCLWFDMDVCGLIWMSMVWYGCLWFDMDVYGLIWMSKVLDNRLLSFYSLFPHLTRFRYNRCCYFRTIIILLIYWLLSILIIGNIVDKLTEGQTSMLVNVMGTIRYRTNKPKNVPFSQTFLMTTQTSATGAMAWKIVKDCFRLIQWFGYLQSLIETSYYIIMMFYCIK